MLLVRSSGTHAHPVRRGTRLGIALVSQFAVAVDSVIAAPLKFVANRRFAGTRHNRGVTRFLRRGRSAVRTEWRLLMATHNLTKLHRHQIATAGD